MAFEGTNNRVRSLSTGDLNSLEQREFDSSPLNAQWRPSDNGDAHSVTVEVPGQEEAGEAPVAKKGCYRAWADKNPRAARALKYGGITLLVLAVIGGLVAMGMTGQFSSTGWLNQTAFPAMKQAFQNFGHWVNNTVVPAVKKFLDMKLTVGQGLAYIGAPIVGAGIITLLGVKFGPRIKEKCQEKIEALRVRRRAEQQASAPIEAPAGGKKGCPFKMPTLPSLSMPQFVKNWQQRFKNWHPCKRSSDT